MKSLFNIMIDFFIPEKLKSPKEVYWRARIISSIHLFLIINVIFSEILCTFCFDQNDFPHFLCFAGLSILLIVFKKWGSFVLSGNLILLLLFLVLFPFSLTTGGIYSYDYLALCAVPMLGFLIAGRAYGFFWLLLITITSFVMYYLEINAVVSYREVTADYDATYYLVLSFFIHILTGCCVAIFDKGQRLIIEELNHQRNLLKENKIELEKKEGELLESNANLKHFAHVASHDLKQPIRTILSFGQLLQKDIGTTLSKDHQLYLDFIISGSKQLQNQIDSVLNHAKIGRSDEIENLESFETLPFVENVILKLQQQIVDSKTKMVIKKLPFEIVGSKIELGLVFQNIISNGIKFRRPDIPLEIKISYRELPAYYEFSIADNGVGVEPDIIEKIFTPMVKSYSKQNADGTGMGLATCEKVIKRHKGSIWVTSELGEGATFIFTISKDLQPDENSKLAFSREELIK